MVGVWKVDAFDAPEDTVGAVATYHNVISAVVGPLDTGKVACHAGRVTSRSSIAIRFFDGEGPRTYGGHFIHDLAVLRGRHFSGLHRHNALLQLHTEYHRSATGHDDALKHTGFIAYE